MRRLSHVAAAVLVGAVLSACGGSDTPALDDESSAPSGVVDFGEFARDHVETDVEYEQNPPVGGPHQPVWQTCGYYSTPILDEYGVHSLEHGAVWITYDPTLPSGDGSVLELLADGKREVLASPYEGLPALVVASAWGVQLQLDSVNDPRLAEFVDYYENGPPTPEPDTPCAGGWDQ